jgi:hypothetical protein
MRYLEGVAVFVSLWIAAPCSSAAVLPQASPAETLVFVRPERKSPPRPAPASPPSLPGRAAAVRPLDLEIEVRRPPARGQAAVVRQQVVRATDRVHVLAGSREWWFRQNPVDPRRVSALLVDHARRTIILHEESEVRNMLGIAGWADLLMMGVEPAAVAPATATRRTEELSGVVFRQHTQPVNGGVNEVWWNEEYLLASRVVTHHEGLTTTVTVTKLRHAAADERLRSPADRFPGYKLIDLAEWLEGH